MQFPWIEQTIAELDAIMAIIERGRKGLTTGFKRLDAALHGLQPGLHIIAGEANMGKTAFASQLAWQIVKNNEYVHVIDITLDDTKFEKVCRLAAHISGLPINTVKQAGVNWEKNPGVYKKVVEAIDTIKNSALKYEILDGAAAGMISSLCEIVRQRKVDLGTLGEEWQLVVFVDSFHDVLPDVRINSENGRYEYIAQALSDLANELDIPIVCTAELRKLNGQRRPQLDDIRESIKIRYEAKSIMLCYNDLGARGEQSNLYWYPPNDFARYPVFEVHVAKNKYNSFKGRLCFEFVPELSLMKEPDDATHRKYLDIVHHDIK
jgi:replicative DNA helicase